jgi:hypothetical protein
VNELPQEVPHGRRLTPCADFSRLLAHIGEGLEAHADRDGLDGVRRGIFLARGGHAPGEVCSTAGPPVVEHHYECEWPDDECTCHWYGVRPTAP